MTVCIDRILLFEVLWRQDTLNLVEVRQICANFSQILDQIVTPELCFSGVTEKNPGS